MGKDLKGRELGTGLYQRPDGRYEARAMVKGHKINLYDTSLKELKIAFEKAKEEAKEGIDAKFKDVTVDEWFEYWFEKYKAPSLKPTSVYPTKSRYKSTFGCTLGEIKLDQLRNLHIQEVVTDLSKKGRATSTIRSSLGILRVCLESAKNNGILRANPSYDIIVPWSENKKVLRRFLTLEERELFLGEAENSYYKEMYYFMLCTGLRIGEVGGLFWSDIDFQNKVIHIERSLSCQYEKGDKKQKLVLPKTPNSIREIPFMGNIEEVLYAWKEKQDNYKKELGSRWRAGVGYEDLVFTTSMGSQVTRYIVEKDMRNMVANINAQRLYDGKPEIEPIYPHALRHTFCSRLLQAGVPIYKVSKLMGHKDVTITDRIYGHLVNKDLEEAIALLEKTYN